MTNPASGTLPMRPMTFGELLDTALALLRHRALPLFALAVPLAVVEQVLLYRLGADESLRTPLVLTVDASWQLAAVSVGTEAFIITMLGGYAAAAAVPALLGGPARHRELWRRSRPVATLVAALLTGLAASAGLALCFVPFLGVLLLCGLVAPALVIDRVSGPFHAFARSVRLSARSGMRVGRCRLIGYLVWSAIRGGVGALWTAAPLGLGQQPWVLAAAVVAANALAFSALACLDAVLLVEARVRTEGLDIAVGRARRLGADDHAALAYRP